MRSSFVRVDDCAHDIFFAVSVPKEAVAHSKIFPYEFGRHTPKKFGTCAYEHTAYEYGISLYSCADVLNPLLDIRKVGLLTLDKAIIVTRVGVVDVLITSYIVFITLVFLFYGRYIVVI